jgi:hypothetical protein
MYNFTTTEQWEESNQNATIPCQNGWSFNKTDFESTIPTDYLWICGKNFYPTSVFSMSAAGIFFGNVIFGPLADKYDACVK